MGKIWKINWILLGVVLGIMACHYAITNRDATLIICMTSTMMSLVTRSLTMFMFQAILLTLMSGLIPLRSPSPLMALILSGCWIKLLHVR